VLRGVCCMLCSARCTLYVARCTVLYVVSKPSTLVAQTGVLCCSLDRTHPRSLRLGVAMLTR
jgi:hypothetical protein